MKVRHAVGIGLVVALGLYARQASQTLRPFVDVKSRGGESCRLVQAPGLLGAEDMEFDPRDGTLWIAAADRRGDPSFRPHDGAFFRLRPTGTAAGKDAVPQRAEVLGLTAPLRLHGLGLWLPPQGPGRLFAVQHGDGGDSVEIFAIEDGDTPRLRHLRSVRTPQFISLNDVAPVGPDAFYVSNDHGRPPKLGHVLEDFAFLSNASVVHFDGQAARTVAHDLRYANGVSVDPSGRFLLVAETTGQRIRVFARQPDASLQQVALTPIDTAPDNFSVDTKGQIWVGAHPSTLQFLRHAKNGNRPSASQVLHFRLDDRGQPIDLTTRWIDDGRTLSGSSIAAAHGDTWLVGAVFADGVLMCATP